MRKAARSLERARDMTIASSVFGEQHVSRHESVTRAVAKFDLSDAAGDEDELALRRTVRRIYVRRRRVAKEEAKRRQVGGSRPAAGVRLHRNFAPLDARAAVGGGENAGDDHAGHYDPSHRRNDGAR